VRKTTPTPPPTSDEGPGLDAKFPAVGERGDGIADTGQAAQTRPRQHQREEKKGKLESYAAPSATKPAEQPSGDLDQDTGARKDQGPVQGRVGGIGGRSQRKITPRIALRTEARRYRAAHRADSDAGRPYSRSQAQRREMMRTKTTRPASKR